MSTWKQPTPTDIHENPNIDTLARMIFFDMWSRVRREDGVVHFTHADRRYSVELDRGQCIYQVSKIAKDLKIDTKRVRNAIVILQKWYTPMEIKGMPYGLLVRFKEVDSMLKMENGMDNRRIIEGEWKDNRRRPKESVENVENEKNVENTSSEISDKKITEQVVEYFNKVFGAKTNTSCEFTPPKVTMIKTLRNAGYSLDDFFHVVDNCSRSPWHVGENPEGWIATFNYMFRNAKQMDKLLELVIPKSQESSDVYV